MFERRGKQVQFRQDVVGRGPGDGLGGVAAADGQTTTAGGSVVAEARNLFAFHVPVPVAQQALDGGLARATGDEQVGVSPK
jgi:hypothetical protein